MVAVDTPERVLIASGVRDIENRTPVEGLIGRRILRGTGMASSAVGKATPKAVEGNRPITAAYRGYAD
jgi:hypothetical protein